MGQPGELEMQELFNVGNPVIPLAPKKKALDIKEMLEEGYTVQHIHVFKVEGKGSVAHVTLWQADE